jgi:hypothetical protein
LRAAGLRAAVPVEALRVAAGFAAFARVAVVAFFALERFAAGFFALERFALLAAACGVPSSVHLPDRTRCAASATASAISEPNLDALETMVLAAAWAVSAASSPASRILRRAAGLALIAAAAAARPAASISRLIAALASLSTVLSPPEDDFFRVVDLAIVNLPLGVSQKTLQLPYGSVSAANRACNSEGFDCPKTLKGTVAEATIPSNMVSGRK